MSPTYEQNKKHIYSWRSKNRDAWKEKAVTYKRKYDSWKRIQKIFLNILLI